ncbi:BRO family protein [Corynebacterium striatum]|uniref:BRO family protein n=1 Tax=Corynebacterium striatum TaxID=43770 RepID=UPI003B58BD26
MSPHLAPVISEPPSPFDAIKNTDTETGTEFWSARDLMPLMGYPRWNEFKVPLERAMKSAEVQGNDVATLFRGSAEKTSGRPREDFHLTRFAAYLVAMNGDPNKPEVAAAQAYFAVKAREAETRPAFNPAQLTRRDILTMALEAEERADIAEAALEAATPALEYHERFVAEDSDVTKIDDFARAYGTTGPKVRELLEKKNIAFRTCIGSRWSDSKNQMVDEFEWRARAGRATTSWFDLRPQHNAPRLHNGQVRQTLYVKTFYMPDLAKRLGLDEKARSIAGEK